jgi:hypothetical protein
VARRRPHPLAAPPAAARGAVARPGRLGHGRPAPHAPRPRRAPGLPAGVGRPLAAAQDAIEAGLAAFPDGGRITAALLDAARSIEAAQAACPPEWTPQVAHRLARKAREIDAALFEAQGVVTRAAASPVRIAPGGVATVEVFVEAGVAVAVEAVTPGAVHAVGTSAADGPTAIRLAARPDAPPSNPYPPSFDPLGGSGEATVRLAMTLGGRTVSRLLDLEQPLLVGPQATLRLDPDAVLINLARPPGAVPIDMALDGMADWDALSVGAPEGWGLVRKDRELRLSPPPDLRPMRAVIRPRLSGGPAYRSIAIPSAPGGADLHRIAELPVLAVEARLPEGARVGYIGGGNDRVGTWLARMGLEVVELDPDRVTHGDLSGLTTLVAGIFAFGTRPDLRAAGRAPARLRRGGRASS